MLTGKKILVGVTGSIAAYKSAFLIRELIREGAEVRVVMSPSGREFITPLTLATLSKNPVAVEFIKPETEKGAGEWENHVELGLWADLFVVAPASANTLAKLAGGTCDNLLMAVLLSSRCPVWVAPAMDLDMFNHPATQENISKLKQRGVSILEPGTGELASGLEGKGRMQEPEEIAQAVISYFNPQQKLKGKKVLITGGPTYEKIDPVRFIGNHSSGLTGVLLAEACAQMGAEVYLISGPTPYKPMLSGIHFLKVNTALDMFELVQKHWNDCAVGIFSAAVADYRPVEVSHQKIKKSEDTLTIHLVKNPDLLSWAGQHKSDKQILIGFALETENELVNAQAKLDKKNLDLVVLNSLRDEGAGFGHQTNKVTFIAKGNKIINFELEQKVELAKRIAEFASDLLK
ncbi:MAG: bifunctional phosphopantothenoylcysteine decarboxylase/phosphopantothenate--cysteine ligase CoaBC [Crocinitomicaceae bacterium]|nr:bifunctional phosphopantothenoylcysteine decarboxylase/phosphopantothenate--cysteine ligase CoaBC [Crocinitomicaceae bacterium]MBK8926787.1 bifunctional phosphopantothenoylcysteine decarboxylase/phosphopantothenate--cysteine ligase CoaBC [Crocinitomicaceae bacterium]